MKRRSFLQNGAAVTVAATSLPGAARAIRPVPDETSASSAGLDLALPREYPGQRGPKTMCFHDLSTLQEVHDAEVVQGEPEWVPEATWIDPHVNSRATGCVYYEKSLGRWRRILGGEHFYIAESEDGIQWYPADLTHVQPRDGQKLAPHHVDTLPGHGQSPGWLYLDPVATDGYPFKMAVVQSGQRVFDRAMANPDHRWHDLTSRFPGPVDHMVDHLMVVSKDGLQWEQRPDYDWSEGRFFPDPPQMLFYNHLGALHSLTCRTGVEEGRVALTSTTDFWNWTDPERILSPELSDGPGVGFTAMPVFPYGTGFIGLAWASNPAAGSATIQDNRIVFSADGEHFHRASDRSFIDPEPLHEAGYLQVRPEGMAVLGDEIRIYSVANAREEEAFPPVNAAPSSAMLMHRLRRDGFVHLRATGPAAEVVTCPLAIFGDEFSLNATALNGEVRVEMRDYQNQPLQGYTFEESLPLQGRESLHHPLQWRDRRNLAELRDTVVRVAIRFHDARIYSLRGDYQPADGHDWRRLRDGLPMEPPTTFRG